jgi:preprotein translocase subunit Sec61beta
VSARRRRESPLPASSAGLLRFFEEDVAAVKLKPEVVVALSAALIIASIMLLML